MQAIKTKQLKWLKGKKGTRIGHSVWGDGVQSVTPRWCTIFRHQTTKRFVLQFTDTKPPMTFLTRGEAKTMARVIYELER